MNINSNLTFIKDIEVRSVNSIPAVTRALRHFLSYNDLLPLRPMLQSVIQELIINAIKANQKRAYFNDRGLDFNKDFIEGNRQFIEILKTKKTVNELPENSPYFVIISFKSSQNKSQIIIQNNAEMHPWEKGKVQEKLQKGNELHDLTEIIENHLDSSEGAGIGLIMSTILLNNAGFTKNSLTFSSESGMTKFYIEIPVSEISNSIDKESLFKYFNSNEFLLPVQSESIQKLNRLEDNVRFDKIRDIIKEDPALLANVLRISAPHLYKKRILERAVRRTGKKVIIDNTRPAAINSDLQKKIQMISQSSCAVGNLCHGISNIFNLQRDTDYPYLAGVLYNIGLILIYSLNPKDLMQLSQLMGHNISYDYEKILQVDNEEISEGLDNAKLGWILTRFWNFPETISQAILFQNNPQDCPDSSKDLAGILYLAKSINSIKNHTLEWEEINFDFLASIGIEDKNEIMTIFSNFINQT